jgi:hypothetical protein
VVVATAAQVGDRWDAPGLGEWDVRALVGHTSRAMLTVEAYLAKPAEQVDMLSAPLYYRATRSLAAELVVDDARAGEVLLALTGRRALAADFSIV